MTDRTDPVVEARPLTAEEEAKFRASVKALGSVDDYGLAGTLHWSNRVAARLLATLDTARDAVPEPSLLREALHQIEIEHGHSSDDVSWSWPSCERVHPVIDRLRAALAEPSKPEPQRETPAERYDRFIGTEPSKPDGQEEGR